VLDPIYLLDKCAYNGSKLSLTYRLFFIDLFIDWCLTPTLAVFQLYRGVRLLEIAGSPSLSENNSIVFFSLSFKQS